MGQRREQAWGRRKVGEGHLGEKGEGSLEPMGCRVKHLAYLKVKSLLAHIHHRHMALELTCLMNPVGNSPFSAFK